MINLKYLIFCLFIPFSSKNFAKEIYWNPALCSINGYEMIFLGADLFYGKDDVITLNGPIRMGSTTPYWINRADDKTPPYITGELPYAYDLVWYDTPERVAYKLSLRELKDYKVSDFNKNFSNTNEYRLIFCFGAKGTVFTYISNGIERILIDKNTAKIIELDNSNESINFQERSNSYLKRSNRSFDDSIKLNLDYINYITYDNKINLIFKGDLNTYVLIEDNSRQVIIYEPNYINQPLKVNFPTKIMTFDSSKNALNEIDLIEVLNKYSMLDNLTLTITVDTKIFQINVTIHQNEKLIYSK